MKIARSLSIIVCLLGFAAVVAILGTPANKAAPPEARIVTDPKIEKRVEELEAKVKNLGPKVKNIEDYFQRKGSRY